MLIEQVLRIVIVIIGLIFIIYWVIYLGNLAWFQADKFERMMSETAKHNPISLYNPKYNWKAIIWIARLLALAGAIALLILGTELILGLIGLLT